MALLGTADYNNDTDSSEFKHNPTLIGSVSVLCVSQQTLKDTLKYLT